MKGILIGLQLLLITLFNTGRGFSQSSYEFTYAYQIKYSKNKSNLKKGNAVLQVKNGISYFADEMLRARAEIAKKDVSSQQKIKEISQLKQPGFKYEIYKSPTALILTEKLPTKEYVGYEEIMMPSGSWNIYSDTISVLGLPCQKATTRFGGRDWTAWFTHKLPVSDGPYKFRGLPGLILRIASEDSDYTFELIQLKKVVDDFPVLPTYTKVSKKKYQEISELAPILAAENMDNRFNSMDIKRNGVSVSKNELLNDLKKEISDRNHIEIER